MKTLDEHNNDRMEFIRKQMTPPDGAGVACPKCKTEMVISNPGQMNASNPPTTSVHCPSCGERGLKL